MSECNRDLIGSPIDEDRGAVPSSQVRGASSFEPELAVSVERFRLAACGRSSLPADAVDSLARMSSRKVGHVVKPKA